MKLLLLLFIGALATPAQANLQQTHQQQQDRQAVELQRRTQLCNNHRAQAQFASIQGDNYFYRVSRGDLYRIRWTGQMTDPYGLVTKPCEVKLVGKLDTDTKVCTNPKNHSFCDPRSTTRWVVEGNQLVSYTTLAHPSSWTGEVKRKVIGNPL
jgi:hypothetical protein